MEDVEEDENLEDEEELMREEGDRTQHIRANRAREYADEARNLLKGLKIEFALGACVRHVSRGIKKDKDERKVRG